MRIEIIRNFFDADTCAKLNAWASLGVENKWLDDGITVGTSSGKLRKTTRFSPDRFTYPNFVIAASNRIRAHCGVSEHPLIDGHGRDGVVVSYTLPGGAVHSHKDPRSKNGLATLRCNVMTQATEKGCVLHVEGNPIEVGVGDLHCYLVSEFEHFVTKSEGNTPRIMWMFGAHVPADDWESGKIKVKEWTLQ